MKKTISILAAFAAFAVFGVTPNTEWQDVPGTDKVGDVLSAGGAVMTEQDPVWNAQKGGYQPKLVSGTNIKTVNGNSLLGNGNVEVKSGDGLTTNAVIDIIHSTVDGAARPLPKYLHLYEADDSYPEAAREYYHFREVTKMDGGCSSVRDGGFLYRNFDYPFDDRAEFVVKMSAGPNRFASVGVAQVGTNLTEAIVASGKPSRCYKWLPGATVDGINENGVACNINVVDGDPQTSGWHTNATANAIHPLGAIRWILDHATNAQHGAEYIAANIRFPDGWEQNFHYMVADATSTYIVENGEAHSPPAQSVVLTNFGVYFEDLDGAGWERFDLLVAGANITNAWYTNAYRRETNPPWVSDLAEVIGETNRIFDAWAAHDKEYFRGQLNGGKPWWQTIHTSIYDLTNRTLRIAVQEQDDWYTFAVPSAGGVKPEAVREIVEPMIVDATNALDAEKRDKDDLKAYEKVGVGDDWVWTSENEELANALNTAEYNKPFFSEGWNSPNVDGWYPYVTWVPGNGDEISVEFSYTKNGELEVYSTTATRAHEFRPVSPPDRLATTNGVNAAITAATNDSSIVRAPYNEDNQRVFSDGLFIPPGTDDLNIHATTYFYNPVHINNIANLIDSEGNDVLDTLAGKLDRTGGEMAGHLSLAGNTLYTDGGSIQVESAQTIVDSNGNPIISATDTTFSNAVLAVQIDTNTVAQIGELKQFFDDLPTGTVGTSLGGIILALLGAAAYLKKKTALLETDGKASNDFATDLLGKQVAISAIDARIKTNAESAAEPTNTVTLNDNAPKTVTVATVESPATPSLAVTFGTARNGGLRICELYILNGTADTDLTFDSAVHFVGTGDSFPACEAGINYFVFAEVAANLWKVTRETLKSITTPTPVAAA